AARAQHAGRTGRAWRVETDPEDGLRVDAVGDGRPREAIGNLREANVRPLLRPGRLLGEAGHEELSALRVEERVIDGRSAEIDPRDDAMHRSMLSARGGEFACPVPRGHDPDRPGMA